MPQAESGKASRSSSEAIEIMISGVNYRVVYEAIGPYVLHEEGKAIGTVEGIRYAGVERV
jgi:hypothetical protein